MSIAFFKDLPLTLNYIIFLIIQNKVLVYDFHSKKHAKSSDKVNFGETSCTEAFNYFEICE